MLATKSADYFIAKTSTTPCITSDKKLCPSFGTLNQTGRKQCHVEGSMIDICEGVHSSNSRPFRAASLPKQLQSRREWCVAKPRLSMFSLFILQDASNRASIAHHAYSHIRKGPSKNNNSLNCSTTVI